MADERQFQTPTALTCPDCGGAVRDEDVEGAIIHRCHIGHRFSSSGLASVQIGQVEVALDTPVRILNERAELCRRMIERLRSTGGPGAADRWEAARLEAEMQRDILRGFNLRGWVAPEEEAAESR